MSSTTRIQRRYDHRLRALVQTTGDLGLAVRHGVPRSTARGWLTQTSTEVVTLDVLELDTVRLQHEVILLLRIEEARARVRLCVVYEAENSQNNGIPVPGFSWSNLPITSSPTFIELRVSAAAKQTRTAAGGGADPVTNG